MTKPLRERELEDALIFLVSSAEAVLSNWESGDLAAAVRSLSEAIDVANTTLEEN